MAGSGFIVVVSVPVKSCVRCSLMAVLALSDAVSQLTALSTTASCIQLVAVPIAGQLSQEVHQRLGQTGSRLFIYACSCSGGV